MTTFIPFGIAALILILLGRWGMRNARRAVSPSLPAGERERRARVLRRGSVCCWVVACLLLAVGGHALLG